MLAAGFSTVIAVSSAASPGYGLARSHFRGKQHVAFWIISTRMAPIAAIVLPLFILFRYVNLLDTIPGLIVAYLTFNLPFAIWIMNAFFMDLPPSLEEAAMVDGASRFQAFYRVALPLVTPASLRQPYSAWSSPGTTTLSRRHSPDPTARPYLSPQPSSTPRLA